MDKPINVITVDGPSGAGKGTLTQMLAQHFEWHILDSGALYRILGVACEQANIDLTQQSLDSKTQEQITEIAKNMLIDFKVNQQNKQVEAYLNGNNLGNTIRTDEAGQAASKVAAISSVRDVLLDKQKSFAQAPGLVADGRDMGTVVFPDAPVKIFLTASAEERGKRRYKQLKDKETSARMSGSNLLQQNELDLSEIIQKIEERDHQDINRASSPLKPADDAIIIDTTSLTIDEVFSQVLGLQSERSIKSPYFSRNLLNTDIFVVGKAVDIYCTINLVVNKA